MKKKLDPEDFTNSPMTGVGILSGFGTPDNPPDYNIKGKKALPREDTHPGTGLKHLNGKADNLRAEVMLGEGD